MSVEPENPAGGGPGDISDDELRSILGDDYDAVVGKEIPAATGGESASAHATSAPGAEPATAYTTGAPGGEPAASYTTGAPGAPPAVPYQAGEGDAEELIGVPSHAAAIQPIRFDQLDDAGQPGEAGIDVLLDVKLPISVELGRTEMLVRDILECGPGTVIELSKLAGEPVDVFINGRMVAQGEVVVVDEHFGVRVTTLLSPRERVRSLA